VAGINDLSMVWKNIKEIDLKPIREAALQPVGIALVGVPGAGKHTLAEQLRTDPTKPEIHTQSTLSIIELEETTPAPEAQLTIILVDASRTDFSTEHKLATKWSEAGKNILVVVNKIDLVEGNIAGELHQGWKAARVLSGSVNEVAFLQKEFIPAVLELLPQKQVALGRLFPLFRIPIAKQLVNETCLSNAAYAFSTGLAEIVPVLDLPLNVTDLVVLTKSQGFLAYKLGLLLGFSTRWQDYLTEFGSVIGGGFLWRQIARSLVGLIPAWGIVPKVAVAYAGTYAVGYGILGWYQSGRKLTPKQMQALYGQAFTQGKEYARKLVKKLPKPKLRRGETGMLPAAQGSPQSGGEVVINNEKQPDEPGDSITSSATTDPGATKQAESSGENENRRIQLSERKSWLKKRTHSHRSGQAKPAVYPEGQRCKNCGKTSSADAQFCQYCGKPFEG
jgi:uncharacterized protein (DUF697 family)